MASQVLDYTASLQWQLQAGSGSLAKVATGGAVTIRNVFYNQALNTLFNYGCTGAAFAIDCQRMSYKSFPFAMHWKLQCVMPCLQRSIDTTNDIYITDPPYGDAVKYEEILEFFIAWLRKNPPPEFADWVWDSRRSLAIKGEGEDFRRGMVAAYKRMTECMPDNGIQVIMFTHQSGSIWADMANIVWASGLQVTAAWYVVTETDSALREGSYVKGTVLLVCRKRQGTHKTTRDDLAWEIQEEVEAQVQALTGLNQEAKGLYRDENVFEDADIQMAGYAAALRVLTRYAIIDGRDMTAEAIRPRVKGETTFVDGLIAFAVDTANQCLVPQGIPKAHWDKLSGAERFYLKMLDMEARGAKTLDNYQNFAKAFKVRDFRALMGRPEGQSRPAQERGRVRPRRDERGLGAVPVGAARRALRRDGTGEERGRQRGAGPPDAQHPQLLRRHDPARAGRRAGRLPRQATRNPAPRRSQRRSRAARAGEEPAARLREVRMTTLPAQPKIFHITHIDNLASIVSVGCIEADSRRLQQGSGQTLHRHDRDQAASIVRDCGLMPSRYEGGGNMCHSIFVPAPSCFIFFIWEIIRT